MKNNKFYLNGKEYKLNGVGFHQDREGYGNAVPKSKKKEDLAADLKQTTFQDFQFRLKNSTKSSDRTI